MLMKDANGKVDSGRANRRQQSIAELAELAAELRALREKSHRSLRELQQSTFASDSSLSRYLSGRTVPPWQVVEALCRLAGRDPAELRAIWESARQARGKRSRTTTRISGVTTTTADPVPERDVPTRDALATSPGRSALGFFAIAAAVGLIAAFAWRRRTPGAGALPRA